VETVSKAPQKEFGVAGRTLSVLAEAPTTFTIGERLFQKGAIYIHK
jgi:hypothetical protein